MRSICSFVSIAVFLLLTKVTHAGLIYSDFFDTDPFDKDAPRWSLGNVTDYGFFWSGFGWDPAHDANLGGPAANLPTSDGNTLVAFSKGRLTVLGNSACKLPAKGELSFDFCIRHNARPEGILVLAQQFVIQPDQKIVAVSFRVNASGQIVWRGGGTAESPETLQPGIWYSFATRIARTDGIVSLESEIRRASDGSVISRAPVLSDAFSGAVPETFRPGIQLDLSPEGYWSRLVEIDNLTLIEE